ADVAEQAGAQRAVDRAVFARRRRRPVQLLERLAELRLDVAPLAHARHREEVLAARLLPFPVEQLPEIEEREEIGALVVELRLALVGRAGLVGRPLARVLHRERR